MGSIDHDITLTAHQKFSSDDILKPDAINFVAHLARRFEPSLHQLLSKRLRVQAGFDSGERKLDFNPHTQDIRDKEWKVPFFPVAPSMHHCIKISFYFKLKTADLVELLGK